MTERALGHAPPWYTLLSLLRPRTGAGSMRFSTLDVSACTSVPRVGTFLGRIVCTGRSFSPFVAQATTALRARFPIMAEVEASSDTAGALRALLANARVPDMLAEHILGLGFQDVADFAFALIFQTLTHYSMRCLQRFGPHWKWQTTCIPFQPHALGKHSKFASSQETHAHMPKALSQPSGPPDAETHASPAIARAEHLPPKLTPEVVQECRTW